MAADEPSPAGSDLLIQIDYKSGEPETDATSMGLNFAKKPFEKGLRATIKPTVADIEIKYRNTLRQKRKGFVIPANDPDFEFTASTTINFDAHLMGDVPHLHLLGKGFLPTATKPDRKRVSPFFPHNLAALHRNPVKIRRIHRLGRSSRVRIPSS